MALSRCFPGSLRALVFLTVFGCAPFALPAEDAGSAQGPDFVRQVLLDGPESPRETLRESGVDFDLWWTQFYQGFVSGPGPERWAYGGRGDVKLNLDGEKLGLWSGFSISIHHQSVYGKDVLGEGGAILAVNAGIAIPRILGRDHNTVLNFSQRFNDRVSLSLGTFNMVELASLTPLIGGGGLDTFMNLALAAPISNVIPAFLLGASLNVQSEQALFNFLVYDPRDASRSEVIKKPFDTGVTVSPAVTIPITVRGRTGYQNFRFVYSTQKGIDLRDLEFNLPPNLASQPRRKRPHWFFAYSFQQHLWHSPTDPSKGWGFFGQLGISDSNPNPFEGHAFVGVGGSSFLRRRADSEDRWGVAYFNYQLSRHLRDSVRPLGEFYGPEEGVEIFYNFAVRPWFRITGDLQVINGFPAETGDSVFLAMRAQLRF